MKGAILCYVLLTACTSGAAQENTMALNVDFAGVWTNPNPHSKVPAGATRIAENVVSTRPGVASTVPGMENLAAYSASDERFSSGISYQGCLIENTSGATPKLYVRDLDAVTLTPESGSFEPPTGVERMPFAVAGDKLYMLTSEGLKVKDGAGEAPTLAGVPAGLALFTTTGGGTLFSGAGESVAYRYLISRQSADGTYTRGAPSGRVVYVSVGTEDVELIVDVPEGLVATDRIEVYRTGIAAAGTDPGDIMYMVAQVNPDSTIVDGSSMSQQITDATPDELRGEPLYTNGTLESIARQNERPPYAEVMLGFDDSLLLANVRAPQRFQFRMLAVADDLDTITIAGVTYTGHTSGVVVPGLNEFAITTTGTVSEQIEDTALSLIMSINAWIGQSPARTVRAHYLSGANDPPGIIGIEAIDVTTGAFTAQASANGDRYEPPLTTAQSSLATTEPNGIWVSKRGDHYAFPPARGTSVTYRFRVGVKGNPILAMAQLREAVIVFVENEGVWRVQRQGAEGWRADQISNNAHLLVPSSIGVVDNRVIALTTRGLVAVDISGVEEIDLPIKDQIDTLKGLSQDVLQPLTFAVTDEGRLRYTLYHPLTNSSTTSDHAWVYNGDTDLFTERTDAASGGLVGEDDGLLYLGDATSNHLTRERTGSASAMYKRPDNTAIPVRLKWTVMDEGDPGAMKQYAELRLLTKDSITGDVTFSCTNDLGGSESTTGSTSSAGEPYVRVWVPDGCQMTSRLDVEIQRSVLGQTFEVVGLKALVPGVYDGGLTR